MSFNFINNQADLKKLNNFSQNSISTTSIGINKNVSIFGGAQTANTKSTSIFSNSQMSASNFDQFTASAQKRTKDTETDTGSSFSLFGAIKSFFAPEPGKDTLVSNAQSVLSKAQSVTSSATAKKLLEDSKKAENGELSDTKKTSTSSTKNNQQSNLNNDNDDEEKENDYSKSSVSELEKAFIQGKPSNSEEAKQMLNNKCISSSQIEKIKDKFSYDDEIQDLIGEMQADVN